MDVNNLESFTVLAWHYIEQTTALEGIFSFSGSTSTGNIESFELFYYSTNIYAVVVTFVAGSLEAGGLPGYPEVF
jgi:hypothetical protein